MYILQCNNLSPIRKINGVEKSMGSQINGVTNQWGHKSMGSQINGVTNQWGHKSMGSDSIDFFIEPFYIAFLGYWDLLYGSSCSFCACSRY